MGVKDFPRRLPDPVLAPLVVGDTTYRLTFVLTLDFWGEGSSLREENRLLPLDGFGQCLHDEYFDLARARAAEFLADNGLRLCDDRSTVAGIRMVVDRREEDRPPVPAGWTENVGVYSREVGDLYLQVVRCDDLKAPTAYAASLWRGGEVLYTQDTLALTLATRALLRAAERSAPVSSATSTTPHEDSKAP